MKAKCPYLGGKPCLEDKCAAWATGLVEEKGEVKSHSGCIPFFWQPIWLRAIAARADGTQRGVEQMRNELHTGNEVFSALIAKKEQSLLPGD